MITGNWRFSNAFQMFLVVLPKGARAISEQGFYNQLFEERSKAVCREYVMCSRVDESARDTKKAERSEM